jgi:hypothetical protein
VPVDAGGWRGGSWPAPDGAQRARAGWGRPIPWRRPTAC